MKMRQTNTRSVAEQKPLGVIDAVSAGLTLVWRRPWTLVVPILFDAMIWLLPRLSLAQTVEQCATANAHSSTFRQFELVQTAPPCSPTNALIAAELFI